MNRFSIIVSLVLFSLMLSSCNLSQIKTDKTASTIATIAVNSPSPVSSILPSSSNSVTISQMSISPVTITVRKGTTITWTNQDSVTHRLVSSIFDSAIMSTNDKFNFVTDTVGTFDYQCSIHPSMSGKIIVTD